MASTAYAFEPDFVFPPGETLRELLEARSITQVELAKKLDMSTKAISHLVNGKMALTPDTALKLERALGVKATFWSNLESRYQTYLAREREAERLEQQKEFLSHFPLREMTKRGWIPDCDSVVDRLRSLLDFFGVASPEAWNAHWGDEKLALFRQINVEDADQFAIAAWLRQGERAASALTLPEFDRSAFLNALRGCRDLATRMPEGFDRDLVDLCAEAGVAVVLHPQIPRTGIAGAVRWFHRNPLIQLTLRYKTADYFWFAFFHEAAHVLLHGRKQTFWESESKPSDPAAAKMEDEANEWAADFLIPRDLWEQFVRERKRFFASDIEDFARSANIHPGIVVGRLHHERRMHFKFNQRLKVRLSWKDEL